MRRHTYKYIHMDIHSAGLASMERMNKHGTLMDTSIRPVVSAPVLPAGWTGLAGFVPINLGTHGQSWAPLGPSSQPLSANPVMCWVVADSDTAPRTFPAHIDGAILCL